MQAGSLEFVDNRIEFPDLNPVLGERHRSQSIRICDAENGAAVAGENPMELTECGESMK